MNVVTLAEGGKRSNEQKLSDVQEAGSKKAPQIHAINNLSAPLTQGEY